LCLIEEVLAAGEVRTPDLGGTATTRQLGEAIRAHLRKVEYFSSDESEYT
jgi:isocitrate/isopropylmalate dehydrogenase